jgi:hypothetical protein
MYERWHRSNFASTPLIDQTDIMVQGHYKLLQKACPLEEMRQHHPEYTQSSYLRTRSLEEAMCISNYLENLPQQQARIDQLSVTQQIY